MLKNTFRSIRFIITDMKVPLSRYKIISAWLLAIMMMAVSPAESKESTKEVEETEEVRLFFQHGKQAKQLPKKSPKTPFQSPVFLTIYPIANELGDEPLPRYILYCNLTFYE